MKQRKAEKEVLDQWKSSAMILNYTRKRDRGTMKKTEAEVIKVVYAL